ncbi:oxidoreductase [Paenibacillus marchantiophytorum]|uniref:Oxidoreductase n=1 Tax=Paenibacillus marchantiophytorum TaxID=1619310 RepID=A0ABQ1FBG9_9BACL|nr:DoxX family protein [Paenibacillus marchantiophytorum]GGA05933.1 oxidoreductase [Paenibacillus marchantiophytorum]
MSIALGLLVIRLVVGLSFVGHGAQKLFGWFGGYGPKGTGGWMESIGIKPGVAMAVIAGLMEFVGGLLFAAGLGTVVAAALIAMTMIVSIVKIHGKNGYWATAGGYEYNMLLLAIAVAVAIMGAGTYSIDALLN